MPRNACTTCRSRKIKCIATRTGESCERCVDRKLQCSYATSLGASSRIPGAPRINTLSGHSPPLTQYPATPGAQYRLVNPKAGYDIGSGTPAEILRENELVHELLILYFNNFSDIHFMFDRDSFLRQFAMGEVPKMILFSMMALGIRYSNLSVFEQVPRSHRGESLHREARSLLKNDFDHPSISTIQTYVLISTYHLTFGGARKAWIYLGIASTICKALRLTTEDSFEPDPFRLALSRRLISTIVLMDCTLSPSLNVTCYFSPSEPTPEPCDDEELAKIRNRAHIVPSDHPLDGLLTQILRQAKFFRQVCIYHRQGSKLELLQALETHQVNWEISLHDSLSYNATNFELHQAKNTLREFTYLHLLSHHIGQLIYFPYLQSSGSDRVNDDRSLKVASCHHHAMKITEILQHTWEAAGFDVHNASIGQILTVSAAILMHACLTASSREAVEVSQSRLTIINDCLTRIKDHCRIFDRVLAQLESFLEICRKSSSSRDVFDKNESLIRHILHYGTAYERMNYRNPGLALGREASPGSDLPPNNPQELNLPVLSSEYADWLATSLVSSGEAFQNCAWMFTDASLLDLYSMPYEEQTFTTGDVLQNNRFQ